jgi:hypothetical protein
VTDLAALEARLAILNLEGEYARTWDIGDAEGWASLFTEQGVFEMAAVGKRPVERHAGRVALADFCRSINESYQGLHLMHVPSLSIDTSEARGWMHFEFRARRGDELLYVAGIYKVLYHKGDEGWRMHHRFEQAVQRGPNSFHGIPASLKSSWRAG